MRLSDDVSVHKMLFLADPADEDGMKTFRLRKYSGFLYRDLPYEGLPWAEILGRPLTLVDVTLER